MKNFTLTLIALALTCLFMASCSTTTAITPRDYGNATGVSIYLGYTSVAEKKGPEFKETVADVWTTIQCIESYADLAESIDEITKVFDACIIDSELTDEEKALCIVLKKRITDKVGQIVSNTLENNDNATEFLLGVREGIAEMIEITK